MEYMIGAVLATATCVFFGVLAGFDRERVFYPVMLVIVATYYILFAAMGGSASELTMESLAACVFFLVAVVGFKRNLWLVAAALAGHGIFDFFHHRIIENPGVPVWWPGFCMGFDVLAGGFFAMLLWKRAGWRRVL